MNDFASLEKTIVRDLSCRLCLCTEVSKLKPLNAEVKRKIQKLFNFNIRTDDNLPKAICHECLQQVGALHLYFVKVEKTQKFLTFHKMKLDNNKREEQNTPENKVHPIIAAMPSPTKINFIKQSNTPNSPCEFQQGDARPPKLAKKKASDMRFLEVMPLEEFAFAERVDRSLLNSSTLENKAPQVTKEITKPVSGSEHYVHDFLDPIVLRNGRPAKHGAALDKQITLFYKMECCICHENGFHFKSLMKHYKERHGVPGYVTCCDKKFHYFYPKKIIEHMAFHLQKNIFMCPSCHQNFQTSHQLLEHHMNGGRSEGKILCPRCSDRYPTFQELGWHILSHRTEKMQCDYCGKLLKNHHKKKTVNHMEDVILCSKCIRSLRNIEKQEKEVKEKVKTKPNVTIQKYQQFRQAMGLSADEEASSD